MKCLSNFIAVCLHAGIVLALSFSIPLIEPYSSSNMTKSAILFIPTIMAGWFFIILKFRFSTIPRDIYEYCDLTVFLAVWIGINQLAFKTMYPSISVRNYPLVSGYFPVLFVLGAGVIVYAWSNRNLVFTQRAWLVVFMLVSLPYTRPLDHYTLAMCFPLMALLYTVHRDARTISNILRNRFTVVLFILMGICFVFQVVNAMKQDFDQSVPDILFFSTAFFTFLLATAGAMGNNGNSMRSIMKTAVAVHVGLMMVLGTMWIVWTASSWGLMSILKYRLWISLLHPNAVAAYLAASLFILEPWKKPSSGHILRICIASAALFMLLLTQSRGMILAFILAALIVIIHHFHTVRSVIIGRKRWITLTIILCAVPAVLVFNRVRYRLINTQMIQDRIGLWQAGWKGIRDKLLAGFGFGSKMNLAEHVTDPFSRHLDFLQLWMSWDRLGRHFHNLYLEVMWIFGLPGLLVFLLIICRIFFRKQLQLTNAGLYTSALALLLFGFFDCPFYYPAIMFLGASLLGTLLSNSSDPGNTPEYSQRKPARWKRSVVPVAVALAVLFFIIIPAFHQRLLFTSGTYYQKHDTEKSHNLLKAAAFYRPPSRKAAEKIVNSMLEKGECIDAVTTIDAFLKCSGMPAIQLMRIHAWLERNDDIRMHRLRDAWLLDRAGLLNENLLPEIYLMQLSSGETGKNAEVMDAMLVDERFYSLLLEYGIKDAGTVTVDRDSVTSILQQRGLYLSSCNVHFTPVVLPSDKLLTRLEKELTDLCDADPQCEKKRRAFFSSMIKAREFVRATRVANAWDLDIRDAQMVTDVQTFRDGSSDYSVIQARKAVRDGDYILAEHHLISASATDMTDPEWFYLMSIVLGSKGEWKPALENINTALESVPGDIRYLLEKGVALYHLSRYREALQIFHSITTISPWSVRAQSYAGIILYELERYQEAIIFFEAARDLTPEDPWAYYNLYMALSAVPERLDEAENVRDTVLKKFDLALIPDDLKDRLFSEDMDGH
jgi:tetratricopeptide (TPR) repeat protein/O-antigen ligase